MYQQHFKKEIIKKEKMTVKIDDTSRKQYYCAACDLEYLVADYDNLIAQEVAKLCPKCEHPGKLKE